MPQHTTSKRTLSLKRVYNRKGSLDKNGKVTVPNKDGRAPVQIEILKDKKRRYFDTGIRLFPDQWNEDKAEPTAKDKQRELHLSKIREIEDSLRDQENKFIAQRKAYSVKDFELTDEKEYSDLIQFWIDEQAKETTLSNPTVKAHNTARTVLTDFLKGKPLYFTALSRKFIDDYNQYLLSLDYNKNTIRGKHFKYLKKYTLRAIQHNLMKSEDNPFNGFKLPSQPVNRPYLTVDEINRIEALQFTESEKNLEGVRDLFLFQCYTGLRLSDVKQITDANIIEDENKRLSLTINASKKTEKPIHLSLYLMFPVAGSMSKPEQILQRNRKHKQFKTFIDYTDQPINRLLKVIGQRASINKSLTSHVGRHTFITRMIYLVPLPTIQKLVQHSDIATTMKYVHISNKEIDENLMKVKDWGV